MKKLTTIAVGIVLAGGLAACGTAQAPAAAPTVHVTQTVTPTPTPTVTKTVAPVTAKTVYVAPAAPTLTACGEGVYGEVVFAGPDTSCPFALNVEQGWSQATRGDSFSVYSPVTGSSYVMACSVADNPIACTGGNNALVEFST